MSSLQLSVVIPVYNEEQGLQVLFDRLYPALDALYRLGAKSVESAPAVDRVIYFVESGEGELRTGMTASRGQTSRTLSCLAWGTGNRGCAI